MTFFRAMSMLALGSLLTVGCTNKEYVFKSEPLGHGPDEYEIYTDRVPSSVYKGEDTGRAGVIILPPVPPVSRTADRQREVMIALQQFSEKMFNMEDRRSKDTVKWLTTFMTDHRGMAPDQPVAIQSALDTLVRAKEKADKLMVESTDLGEKEATAEKIKKLDEEIAFFKKYVEERPAKAAEYKRKVDELEASNKRIQMWQARYTRMGNTIEWTQTSKSSADAELNRAVRELADTLTHPDDQTKMEALAMTVNIGGSDAKAMLPRVKLLADDATISPEVRAFALKAAESIEGQAG